MKLSKNYIKRIIIGIFDTCMVPLAWFLAYWIRYNLEIVPTNRLNTALEVLPIVITTQLLSASYFGLYRGVWRFTSIPDLLRIVKSTLLSIFLSVITLYILNRISVIPRSIFPLYGLLLVFLLGGSRLLFRVLNEQALNLKNYRQRVLIVGAGYAGESLIRNIRRNHGEYYPVALVDDDKYKYGQDIHGVPVVGDISQIPEIVKKYQIDLVFIAVPSADATSMRKIVSQCEKAGVLCRTLPSLRDLADGKVSTELLRSVSIEDLLGRESIRFDSSTLKEAFKTETILVTGAGGSIGSMLCKQILSYNPKALILVDNSEYNLYAVHNDLLDNYPNAVFHVILADVTNELYMEKVFKKYSPTVIFHSAAYKHVPLLEENIYGAIRNNIYGTYMIAKLAKKYHLKKMVLISTDKAVNPKGIMGATKRASEIVCQYHQHDSKTQYIIVRFGNVLGSSGSVVPLFNQQIRAGGPITVTHPEVERFFMTITEASQLILKAMNLGKGGETFILDMGEPVKIQYLAEQMIRLSGKEVSKDISIIHIGLRPGEKIKEELVYKHETLVKTSENKIMQTLPLPIDHKKIHSLLSSLVKLEEMDEKSLRFLLDQFVPEFQLADPDKILVS